MNVDEAIHVKSQMSCPTYVSSYDVSSLLSKTSTAIVIRKESGKRLLYHVVATHTYYGYTTGCFDAVMIEADNALAVAKFKNGEFSVRFARGVMFVRVKRFHDEREKCRSYKEKRPDCFSF